MGRKEQEEEGTKRDPLDYMDVMIGSECSLKSKVRLIFSISSSTEGVGGGRK